jgi:hypothetical protein
MPTKFLFPLVSGLVLALGIFTTQAGPAADPLAKGFAAPPFSAAPRTWWHWMNGNVTKEGVTADLEAMKRVGVRAATIVIIGGGPKGPISFQSPQFYDMVKFAASEAKRLGIELGLENCAGWSSSGGQWVTPEYSMQIVTSSEKTVTGPATFAEVLPQPHQEKNYYRDIRVIAFPSLEGDGVHMSGASPTVTASAADFHDPKTHGYRLPYAKPGSPQYLQFEFPQPYQARTFVIDSNWDDNGSGALQASDDGQKFRTLRPFDLRFHCGVQTYDVQPTSAKFYRVVFTTSSGRGSPQMVIPSIDITPAARVDNWLLKCDGAESRVNDNELQAKSTPDPGAGGVIHLDKTVDLTAKMDSTGKLTWDVPAGKWTILRIGYTTNGMVNHPATQEGTGLECDKLSRTAAKVFWAGLMGKVTQDLGPLTGTAFKHTLIDSYEVGCQNWSPVFADEFKRRRGYDLLPYMALFTGRIVESPAVSDRVLWDVRRTIADLFTDNYYGYFAQLAHQSHIKIEVEPYGDGPFDDLEAARGSDRVMGEFWWPNGDMGSVKLASSVVHTYGKTLCGAESFTSGDGGWDMSPPTMKALGDRAFATGINSYTFHRYCMQPWLNRWPGMVMLIFGSNIERTETWWEQSKAWMQYISRCQYLLQQGYFVGDVLFHEGEGAPVSPMTPPRSVLPAGYDYDGCDTDVILHRLSVKDGNLVLPNGASYRVLVLPRTDKMTPPLLRKIKQLADGGATIMGQQPDGSPSLSGYPACDAQVKSLAADLWGGGKIVTGKTLPEVLKGLAVQPDFEPADPTVRLLYIHRRIGGNELYFISNQADTAQVTDALFRVTGKTPELWHPDTGKIEKAPAYSIAGGRTRIPLRLDPAGSVFVLFRDTPPPADHPVSLDRTDAAAPPPADLQIQKAVYGSPEGDRAADVTAKVTAMVQKGALHVEAVTQSFGEDPAPMIVKQLRVDYTLNGQAGSKTVPEGGSVDIASPQAVFPDAELKSGTGDNATLEAWQPGTYSVTMADGQTKSVPVTGLAQPAEVSGSWSVAFPPNWGAPPQATFDKLISWIDSPDNGIKYFSGTANYTKTITIPAGMIAAGHHLYLDLGDVQVIAEPRLNGKSLGILWKPPYCVEITGAAREGDNALEVKVTNLWPNRVIGDEQLPEDSDRTPDGQIKSWPQWLLDGKPSPTGRLTFASDLHWKKTSPLFPSGLIGPVTLRPTVELPLP